MGNRKIEVCVDSVQSALIAQKAGAYRVEFCDNLVEGGTTPSYGQLQVAREQLELKLYVIIRPRGGNFLYSDVEFEVMKADIIQCGKLKCDGVVIGLLMADGAIDTVRTKELVLLAQSYGMGVTFHRAFDRCNDLIKGLEEVIACGCERILTSGGRESAAEGAEVIRQLIERAGTRIVIMPGAGITPDNVAQVAAQTGANELHGTLRSRYAGAMGYLNPLMRGEVEENFNWFCDSEKVSRSVEALKGE
ncbi:MAG: copper homeostasis protein CutC [Phocaeicola sp.]